MSDDGRKIVKPRAPAECLADKFGLGDDLGRVTGSPRRIFNSEIDGRHPLDRVQDLAHRETMTVNCYQYFAAVVLSCRSACYTKHCRGSPKFSIFAVSFWMSTMSKSIVLASAATMADLEPAPISPDWILSGTPEARAKLLAKSHDGTSYIMVWECSAGRFMWHYIEDEIVAITSGEVFITIDKGEERRLGQGDMAFFPAGTSCEWRINNRVRKVAVLRKPLGFPLGLGVRAWYKFLNVAGLRARSPL